MKKIIMCLTAAFLSVAFLPVDLEAGTARAATTLAGDQPRAGEASADQSTLSTSDRDARGKDTGAPASTRGDGHGGIYISVGALIIIILLVIILL